jgi:hypothetical protein
MKIPESPGDSFRKQWTVMKLTLKSLDRKTSFRVLALAGATLGMIASAHAYSSPPSWMPMTMLNVSLDTSTLRLDVVDQATKMGAGVYAGLTLAPLGTYDPAQPWAVLNHTEYSRRLGWDDANRIGNTDPSLLINNLIHSTYGPGASIWIDCLSKSAGLECYLAVGMYGTNSPSAYSGIFGTAGSATKWQWDGMMDHNTYAVDANLTSPGQLFSATYKVYIGDALGNEILNPDNSSASTIETWTWQAVPEPTTMSLALLGLAGVFVARTRKS